MHRYRAFDLGITSSLVLPELTASAELKEDVLISMGDDSAISSDGSESDFPYAITPDRARLSFSAVGTFYINNGREISVFPLPEIEERLIRLPLLGACLAVLLYQRGNLVLHASAVEVNGGAVAFVGNKGDGKSTLAAMLHGRGHRLISDDTVALDLTTHNTPTVLPGFPQFKLYPDAVVAALRDDPEKLPEIASNVDKRARRADRFCSQPLPLKAVYLLGEGSDLRISELGPQRGLRFLIAHSYMARFTADWIRNGIASGNFHQCAELGNEVPLYLLERPRDLSLLESTARAIEKTG